MKPPPGCRRLSPLGAALGAVIALSFTLGLLGGPFLRRAPPAAPCRPRSHVVFLKTHKTGGSSVLNLLSRYGESRRLRFALPRRYQFGYPAPFRAERVRGFSAGGRKFDIICHHMRFNLSEVQRVMPNDSFYFSIVRRPGPWPSRAFSLFQRRPPGLPELSVARRLPGGAVAVFPRGAAATTTRATCSGSTSACPRRRSRRASRRCWASWSASSRWCCWPSASTSRWCCCGTACAGHATPSTCSRLQRRQRPAVRGAAGRRSRLELRWTGRSLRISIAAFGAAARRAGAAAARSGRAA
uniref:Uncharacterized protein n=1 Tax=Geospiza parvula TaxID=87175 RepID=A0A8U8BRU9_GEOPR